MPNTNITPDQLKTLFWGAEMGGDSKAANRFSWAEKGHSTYSFGLPQFDVGHDGEARNLLRKNGFDSDDIKNLSKQGGLAKSEKEGLDAKLQAVPQSKIDQLTTEHLDRLISDVDLAIEKVRLLNPAAADLIAKDTKLQLSMADYDNQFGSVGPQLIGFLAGKPQTLYGGTVQSASTPTRDDLVNFVQNTKYGQDSYNANAILNRDARFDEAMQTLNLGQRPKIEPHTSDNVGSVIRLGARGNSVSALQADLGALGYADSKGLPLKPDKIFGPGTDTAVRAFQRDHKLLVDGVVGTNTLKAIHDLRQEQAREFSAPQLPNLASAFDDKFAAEIAAAAKAGMDGGLREGRARVAPVPTLDSRSLTAPPGKEPGPEDPRNSQNPNSALYNKLQERIPDASQDRLLQFTTACHSNKITADNLSMIHLDEASMTLGFHGTSFLSTPAFVDLNTPPPRGQAVARQLAQQVSTSGQNQSQNAPDSQQNPARAAPQPPVR